MSQMNLKIISIFLFFAFANVSAVHAEDYAALSFSDAMLERSLKNSSLETVIADMLDKKIPIPLIISKLKRLGLTDTEIINALLNTTLPNEEILFYVFQSAVSIDDALSVFQENGIKMDAILTVLIRRDICLTRMIEICQSILDQGYAKITVLQMFANAGADSKAVMKVGKYFAISPAIITLVRTKSAGDKSTDLIKVGHIFSMYSLSGNTAIVTMGLSRITGYQDDGEPTSPSKPN